MHEWSFDILHEFKSVFLMTGVIFRILLCAYMCLIFSEDFNFNLSYINKLQISDDIE